MASIFSRLFRQRGGTYEIRVSPNATAVLGKSIAEIYNQQPALQSVVSFVSENVAQLPLKVYHRESDTDRRRDTTGTVATLLRRPNANMTCHDLMSHLVSDMMLYGWALWYVAPNADTEAGWEISSIPPAWVRETPTVDGFVPSSYIVRNPETDKVVELPAADCIRFAYYTPNGMLEPVSPVEALKQVLAEQISAWDYRNNVWRNGGQVSAYLKRPAGVEWSNEQRDRFAKSWKAHFTGGGTDTGGTPILEDGMDLVQTQFNARETQWAEAQKLAREDVAAIYHINPALIWHTDGQTYASAKENARALYSDALAPMLDLISERINAFLLPLVGEPADTYVEFDLQAKLAGSFEERASVMQSSVGAPWMTRNEARAMLNLPAIDGADELVVPLNVIEGGLASPNDTAGGYYAAEVEQKSAPRKSRGRASARDSQQVTDVLRKFVKRQSRRVTAEIRKHRKCHVCQSKSKWAEWWDADRWNRELADDLEEVFIEQFARASAETARDLDLPRDSVSTARARNYLRAMAEGKAKAYNNVTYRQLMEALDGDISEDALGSTVEGVFEKAEDSRASCAGISFATSLASWTRQEVLHQQGDAAKGATKTWIHNPSGNPRSEHLAMDGETVPFEDNFSNGMRYPGDMMGDDDELANCNCEIEVTMR